MGNPVQPSRELVPSRQVDLHQGVTINVKVTIATCTTLTLPLFSILRSMGRLPRVWKLSSRWSCEQLLRTTSNLPASSLAAPANAPFTKFRLPVYLGWNERQVQTIWKSCKSGSLRKKGQSFVRVMTKKAHLSSFCPRGLTWQCGQLASRLVRPGQAQEKQQQPQQPHSVTFKLELCHHLVVTLPTPFTTCHRCLQSCPGQGWLGTGQVRGKSQRSSGGYNFNVNFAHRRCRGCPARKCSAQSTDSWVLFCYTSKQVPLPQNVSVRIRGFSFLLIN